jgi:hypothetical protein
MPPLAWMKKLASILLLVCFVLPLSKCETKKEVDGVAQIDATYAYGYQMALGDLADIGERGLDALQGLGFVAIVFFVPAISLWFKEGWQSLIQLCAAFPALYALYGWVIVFATTPQIGGVLALECWLFLLTTSALTLWLRRRRT